MIYFQLWIKQIANTQAHTCH